MFLFWLVIISLLSILDEIDICYKLLVDDVWEAEYDNTGFFSVGVDSFDQLFLKKRPVSLPVV